jgi:hypothetical protein
MAEFRVVAPCILVKFTDVSGATTQQTAIFILAAL